MDLQEAGEVSQRTVAPEDPRLSPGDTPVPSSAWQDQGQRHHQVKKQVRHPPSSPSPLRRELAAGRIHSNQGGGPLGGFIQARAKEVEGSILKRNRGFLLGGPQMNHSRAGDTPSKQLLGKDTRVGKHCRSWGW